MPKKEEKNPLKRANPPQILWNPSSAPDDPKIPRLKARADPALQGLGDSVGVKSREKRRGGSVKGGMEFSPGRGLLKSPSRAVFQSDFSKGGFAVNEGRVFSKG